MNNSGTTWKRHLLVIGFRCACMAAITITGPLVGVDTQPERPDGSEQAPGVAGLLFVAGVVAAVVFALIASSVHWFLRRRPLKTILLAEALLAAAFITFMAHNGSQAKSRPTPAGKTTAAWPRAQTDSDLKTRGWPVQIGRCVPQRAGGERWRLG